MLYQPSPREIHRKLEHAVKKWPRCASRADKAEAILLAADVHHGPDGWKVTSQADVSVTYLVDLRGCGCPDYVTGGLNLAGRSFCKHWIAFLAYRDILNDRLNELEFLPATSAAWRRLKTGDPVIVQQSDLLVAATINDQRLDARWTFNHHRGRRELAGDGLASFAKWLYQRNRSEAARQPSAHPVSANWPPSGILTVEYAEAHT